MVFVVEAIVISVIIKKKQLARLSKLVCVKYMIQCFWPYKTNLAEIEN